MNDVVNFMAILLLYFLCMPVFSMELTSPNDNAKSQLTLSDSGSRKIIDKNLLIVSDSLGSKPNPTIKINKSVSEGTATPKKNSLEPRRRPAIKREQTVSRKKLKRGLTTNEKKKQEIKNLEKPEPKETIEIPAIYTVSYSKASLFANEVSKPLLIPKNNSKQNAEERKLRWSREPSENKKSIRASNEATFYFDRQKKVFLDGLNTFLRDESVREYLIYLYPLFLDDVTFFDYLQTFADEEQKLSDNKKWCPEKKKWLIRDLLNSFVVQGVFLDFPSTQAIEELEFLLNKIDANDGLRQKIWLALDAKNKTKGRERISRRRNVYKEIESLLTQDNFAENKLPEIFLHQRRRIAWSDAKYIAQLLTLRDSHLFRAVSVDEILLWVRKGHQTFSITKLDEINHATSNFLALLLICEKNEKSRLTLAEKYVAIGKELYKLHNFFGLSQIVVALKNPEANRLFKWDASKKYQEFLSLEGMVTPLNNFHGYKLEMDKLENGEHYLPLITDLWRDLNSIFEQKPGTIDIPWLGSLGQVLATIQQWKNHSAYDIAILKENFNFMKEMVFVPEDVLEEFSNAVEPYNDRPKVLVSVVEEFPMIKWTFLQLKAFLLEFHLSACITPLLMKGIWSGQDLLKLLVNEEFDNASDNRMESRKKLVEIGCPIDEANTLVMNCQLALGTLH